VRRAVDKLGSGFKSFLDRTSRGNDAAVLQTLFRYASGELTITQEAA
jgi:hypothetical protein